MDYFRHFVDATTHLKFFILPIVTFEKKKMTETSARTLEMCQYVFYWKRTIMF